MSVAPVSAPTTFAACGTAGLMRSEADTARRGPDLAAASCRNRG
jgi:hypothetical protein